MQICQIKEFIVPSHSQLSLFWTKSLLAFFYSFPGCPLIPCCNRRQQKRDEWESNSASKQQRDFLSSLQKHPMIKAQITKQHSKPRNKKEYIQFPFENAQWIGWLRKTLQWPWRISSCPYQCPVEFDWLICSHSRRYGKVGSALPLQRWELWAF